MRNQGSIKSPIISSLRLRSVAKNDVVKCVARLVPESTRLARCF